MIDPENEVYTHIVNTLIADQSLGLTMANFANEYVASPPVFPHVYVTMSDQSEDILKRDKNGAGLVVVVFTINVYSNKLNGAKLECKRITNAVIDAMVSKNFTLLSNNETPNRVNSTTVRRTAMLRAETDGRFFYRFRY